MKNENNSGFYGGVTLLTLGILFLLDNFNMLDFGDIVSTFWPVVLIIIGIFMIMKVRKVNPPGSHDDTPITGVNGQVLGDKLSENNIFGDLKLKVSSDKFTGGSVSNIFGDIEIDLSGCTMVPGRSKLNINGIFGDVSVFLPGGTRVRVDCSVVAGDITVEGNRREGLFPRVAFRDVDYSESKIQLDIQGSMIFGSIKINRK